MRYPLALALCGGMALAASVPVRELRADFPDVKGATFVGGRLFDLGSSMVRAYAPDGTRDFDEPILTPEGQLAWPTDIAVDPDRSFAVATRKGIALLNERGIQTSSFLRKASGRSISCLALSANPGGQRKVLTRRTNRTWDCGADQEFR